ncbi:MAG TPA: DUF3137 domain-containing protein [Nocardioidaceae bacterium]|nr:DUF3137 domain-containing protein [Nocardioidaceae bacterium]
MNSGVLIIFFACGLMLVLGVALLGAYLAKKRRDAFRIFAASKGWTYTERDDRWCTHFQGHPFGEGHNLSASNVVTGQHDGRSFVAFDYVFHTTESSTNSQGHSSTREVSHDFGIVAVDAEVAFPQLAVTPEGFFTRFVGKLLNKDIELESDDFNRAFSVTCEDRKFASDVLHPRMMETLLAVRDIGWEFNGHWLLAFEQGHHELAELERRLGVLDAVLDGIPEFVWREVRGQ